MKLASIAWLLLIFFSCSATVWSQENPVTVRGIVLDSITNETIPYATIKIANRAKPEVVEKAVPTDESGKFRFAMNKKGEYVMSIEYLGKQTTTRQFAVGDAKTVDLGNIHMPDDSHALSEVVVSAQKPLVKVDLDKITYSTEDDPESQTSTALDILKKVPMVTVDGDDKIQLKGSSGYKIYMNGKPSTMIANNPSDVLKSMPASTIKNIEVITDPGAKYDAEGLAGIINIITHKQTSMGGYNARINSRVDSRGGFGFGGFLSAKSGKFGFTGNYNYYDYTNGTGTATSFREDKMATSPYTYVMQNGTSKFEGHGQYGSGELSYEIDTLNLLNVGFSRYSGVSYNNSFSKTQMKDSDSKTLREFDRWTDGDGTYGSTELNVDYQHNWGKVKDRMLTASYKLSLSPDDRYSDNTIDGILDYKDEQNIQYSDGDLKEHTFQLDYTTPFAQKHTFEAGAKYILRLNESHSGYRDLDAAGVWHERVSDRDRFKHEQDILSAYLGYSLKLTKWGFKTGLRLESTNLDVEYPLVSDGADDFSGDYTNLIPSATVTYQINPAQNLRLGYNMRISRPGIWQLNPYPNTSDTMNIEYGNPNLDAVKAHSLSANYSYFNPKINFNVNLAYNFSNNNIEELTLLEDGIRKKTYGNVGENKRLGLYTYMNWTISEKLKLTTNLSGAYIDVRSNDELKVDGKLKNSGFTASFYGNAMYTLPLKFRLNGFAGFGTSNIELSGRGYSYNFHGLSISRDFLGDKLNVNIQGRNFIQSKFKYKYEEDNPSFRFKEDMEFNRSRVMLSVAFKFGEMKAQIKKAQRGINNDDTMGGNQGQGQGQGQGG